MAEPSLSPDSFEQDSAQETQLATSEGESGQSEAPAGTMVIEKETTTQVATEAPYRSWIFNPLLFLASTAGGLSNVCIKQLLLPLQVSMIDPHNTATSLAIVAALGALVGMIAAPFSGALSDRTTWRLGRRRSWMLLGICIAVIGMVIMAYATNLVNLLLGEILAQVGIDSILSTVTAIIPDRLPLRKRAIASSLVGIAPNVGGVVGLLLVTSFTNTRIVSQGYLLMAGASLFCVLLFLVIFRESPLKREDVPQFHLRHFLSGFLHPLLIRDFSYTLLSRTLAFLSFTIEGTFLLYSLEKRLHLTVPLAARSVTLFQVFSTILLFIAAIITGILAERAQRLKPFVVGGSILMALGMSLLAWLPSWTALWASASIFGVGYGIYMGVDVALAIRILPSQIDRGKDLGLLYTATFFALILSPIVGAIVLNVSSSFEWLFTVAALSSVLAAITILPIRSVQ